MRRTTPSFTLSYLLELLFCFATFDETALFRFQREHGEAVGALEGDEHGGGCFVPLEGGGQQRVAFVNGGKGLHLCGQLQTHVHGNVICGLAANDVAAGGFVQRIDAGGGADDARLFACDFVKVEKQRVVAGKQRFFTDDGKIICQHVRKAALQRKGFAADAFLHHAGNFVHAALHQQEIAGRKAARSHGKYLREEAFGAFFCQGDAGGGQGNEGDGAFAQRLGACFHGHL